MRIAKHCTLGVAGVAAWLAAPAAWAQSRGFDGVWRAQFSGNQFCYSPNDVARWTIKGGVVAIGRGHRGTVDASGRVRIRFPGPYYGKMNVITARLSGNQGTGSNHVEGTRCSGTLTITRVSG
jgi:hypothetical protein